MLLDIINIQNLIKNNVKNNKKKEFDRRNIIFNLDRKIVSVDEKRDKLMVLMEEYKKKKEYDEDMDKMYIEMNLKEKKN